MITRRTFAAGLAISAMTARGSGFQRTIGLQLYSLRHLLEKDVPGTLDLVRRMGFREVEVSGFYGLSASAFLAELAKAGLAPKSMIGSWEEFDRGPDRLAGQAEVLGVKYAVCANIPTGGDALTAEECRTAIARFNRWCEVLRKAGVQFCYHPHGPEFQPSADGTLFDTLVRETTGTGVEFELDTFWVVHGGEDPAGLLRRHPGRFPLSHIKDKKKGTPLHIHPRDVAEEDSVVLGTGMVDWKSFLREAQRAGMKHFFIEEEHPDAVRQIRESLRYLKSLEL